MIEHREDPDVARLERRYRPTLARTLCRRWVDVVRLASSPRPSTCERCQVVEARRAAEVPSPASTDP